MSMLWSTDRPEFLERLAKLAGGTTYRQPGGGRGTDTPEIPDEHAIAAALAFARRGPDDIGPDVAYCWALQSDAYRQSVVRRLSTALRCRELQTVSPHRLDAAGIAWDVLIHNRRGAQAPVGCPVRLWDRMLLAGISTLHNSAWDALAEAERRYRHAA